MEGRLAELRIDKNTPEYYAGVHEGRRQERGKWIVAMDILKIEDKVTEQIIGEVVKLYEGE